ncbi:leucine-rich repeat-containing protein [Cellulophaga algicola DSM 14237]|uniref:Leucine-rich repeat-containing protein n=2 Tax=Cellulophaga TaxID=104264 RepID=E6XC74_CELAD|nr:leucine-rich repeat-containing protein [Cellulophaga algicola DSM 14237]
MLYPIAFTQRMAYEKEHKDLLNLSNQNLKEVPKSILKNLKLRELNLSNNQLTELPDFITELKYLEVLNLRGNNFTNVPELLLQFKYLKTLSLSENQFKIIPETLKALTNLKEFDFGANPLVEFPQWIDTLYALKDLGIFNLKLKQVPEVVTRIKYLEVLSLDGNQLESLPENFANLRYLKELWAADNCFEYLPENFGKLHQLEKINFGNGQLKCLPESIGELRRLDWLSVDENKLQELPSTIGLLHSLTFLDISYNKITSFPSSFFRLHRESLEIWFNGNLYTEETKVLLKNAFPGIDEDDLEEEDPESEEYKHLEDTFGTGLNNSGASELDAIGSETSSGFSTLALFIGGIIFLGIIVFFTVVLRKKDPIIEAHNEAVEAYNEVVTSYEQHRDNILKNNKTILVYTNDTTLLEAYISPNIDVYKNPYAPSYNNIQSKTDALIELLNDKSLGYQVVLDNGRVRLIQGYFYDSVFPPGTMKKYRLLADYKMSDKEKGHKKKNIAKYPYMESIKKTDTVFNTEGAVLSHEELVNRKMNSGIHRLMAPLIDLDNEEYHFYFSPYDNNYSKQEFLEAIEDFKVMFLKEHKKRDLGRLQEIAIKIN